MEYPAQTQNAQSIMQGCKVSDDLGPPCNIDRNKKLTNARFSYLKSVIQALIAVNRIIL